MKFMWGYFGYCTRLSEDWLGKEGRKFTVKRNLAYKYNTKISLWERGNNQGIEKLVTSRGFH